MSAKPFVLLVADDDPEDRSMLVEALSENELSPELRFVEDGEQLLDYLENRGEFADTGKYPRPGLILLDLNMPKKDGREALTEIRSNPKFMDIPIVVLTTSKAEEDILRSYTLGASSYITKPVTFDGLVALIRDLGRYWFEVVQLPVR